MKRSFLRVIMVAVVLSMAALNGINLLASNTEDYIKNDVVVNGLVTERIIYVNSEGMLNRHIHYIYSYNTGNQMTCKKAEKWDSVSEEWKPYFQLEMAYENDEVVVTYARWNQRTKHYDKDVQVTRYKISDNLKEQLMANR